MITENLLVPQIEVIVAELLFGQPLSPQCIVKGSVHVKISSVHPENVPGMAVFDSFFQIVAADRDEAPQAQGVAENLHRLGNAFADPHSLAQRTDDFVGIRLFQLVVAHIGADEIMDVFLLFQI